MTIIYQLKATGNLKGFYNKRSIFSKKVFTHKREALAHEPVFRELVTNEKEFLTLEEPVFIDIHELELDATLIKMEIVGGTKDGD